MVEYTPTIEQYAGSDASGSDGDSDRTITLSGSNIDSNSIILIVDGTFLVQGASNDYTYSASVLTFKNALFDASVIQVQYLNEDSVSTASSTSRDTKYTSLLAFNQALEMDKAIPNRDSGTGTPTLENVGTGDSSTTVFYFDQGFMIRNSETLYTGGTTEATATTEMTVDTHYTISEDLGKLTLTAAGVTLVSTNNIYAEYSYNRFSLKDTLLYQRLLRAEDELDDAIETVFYDGTAATPDFGTSTDEIHDGRGVYDVEYQMDKYPVNDTTTTLNGAVSADDGTITVVSTNGFPSSGSFACETDKITYTGKTGTTFTGCTSVSAHDDGETVTAWVIETSNDSEGSSPTYATKEYQVDYDIDFEAGMVRINKDSLAGTTLDNMKPPFRIWNRLRFNYQYGFNTIPDDIVKCVHLIAGKEGFSSQVLNAISRGTDGFATASIGDITTQIEKIKSSYRCWLVSDTKP